MPSSTLVEWTGEAEYENVGLSGTGTTSPSSTQASSGQELARVPRRDRHDRRGILIALGLEQAVEAVHERHIADQARDAIRAEVRENLWWVNARGTWAACNTAHLDQIGEVLARAERGQAFPLVHDVLGSGYGKFTTLRWEANSEAGRASLFPSAEQRSLDNIYFTTTDLIHWQDLETRDFTGLRALEGQTRVSPQALPQLRTLYEEARLDETMLTLTILRAKQLARTMELTPDAGNQLNREASGTAGRCRSVFEPGRSDPLHGFQDELQRFDSEAPAGTPR